jgi:hypothetical protein
LSAKSKRIYSWQHGWVRVGKEVIDGNTESLAENVMVPRGITAVPYWGPIELVPGRRLEQDGYVEDDPDVMNVWWPDLKGWIETEFSEIR